VVDVDVIVGGGVLAEILFDIVPNDDDDDDNNDDVDVDAIVAVGVEVEVDVDIVDIVVRIRRPPRFKSK